MRELIKIGIESLEVLFFAGWAGSLIVLLLSGVEDVHEVLKSEPNKAH